MFSTNRNQSKDILDVYYFKLKLNFVNNILDNTKVKLSKPPK